MFDSMDFRSTRKENANVKLQSKRTFHSEVRQLKATVFINSDNSAVLVVTSTDDDCVIHAHRFSVAARAIATAKYIVYATQ